MTKLTFLVASLICLSCNSNDKLTHRDAFASKEFVARDSIEHEYLKILSGLKRQNVLYYRNLKSFGANLQAFGMPKNDSIFKMDSIKYFESYERFFQQDYHFIDWLLKFKNDTTNGGLWQEYLHPHSSYIGECHLPMNNSRAAINLLENFLNGSGFTCYECNMDDLPCSVEKYQEIEKFLKIHKGKDIDSLRKEWSIRNAR